MPEDKEALTLVAHDVTPHVTIRHFISLLRHFANPAELGGLGPKASLGDAINFRATQI